MKKSRLLAVFFLFISLGPAVFAQPSEKAGGISDSDLQQGYESFRNKDWTSATMFLRKAISYHSNMTDGNYFMLIKSEIYSGEYKMAQSDCEKFLSLFPQSVYEKHVKYQNGRMLHLLGKNEDAVFVLSDFCRQYSDDELYPLALYWVAESFYDEYNFDSADGIYKRIVSDFPGCEKTMDSQYKIDLIAQRSREEKLLYLLKSIGEENLSTREEYERQIKIYEIQDKLGLNRQVIDLQTKIDELEAALAKQDSVPNGNFSGNPAYEDALNSEKVAVAENKNLTEETPAEKKELLEDVSGKSFIIVKNPLSQDIEALKRKAKQLQFLLDEQNFDEQNENGEK